MSAQDVIFMGMVTCDMEDVEVSDSNCVSGLTVNTAFTMQRVDDNSSTVITLGCDGDDPIYISGSSTATASTSGIAALVWSKLGPLATAQEVRNELIQASSNNNNEHTIFGTGWIDVVNALQ